MAATLDLGLDSSFDPQLQSWVLSANEATTDFPIQNLPFGRYVLKAETSNASLRIGVAIGDQVLDLQRAGLITSQDMTPLMQSSRADLTALRLSLSEGLRVGSASQAVFAAALIPQAEVQMALPCDIGDYTDFFIGIHHAVAVGKLFRPDNPLLPNYKWVPIGYHGRASSIVVSGTPFKRPNGQRASPPSAAAGDGEAPQFGPTKRLDYELELGLVIGRGNAQGEPISMATAEDHLFGIALFNDWSARDIQAWEYQPLGPFLAKNFASSLSPWVVTMQALAPFRRPFVRPAGDPQPLPYLDSETNRTQGAVAITLEVWLQTAAMREAGHAGDRLSTSNFTDGYWTAAQLVAHHTVNGCNLQSGDLFGSGTLSGPRPDQGGSLLELTQGGKLPINLSNGEVRTFLEDGDTVTLRGFCERDGFRRIGFGSCSGTVTAAS